MTHLDNPDLTQNNLRKVFSRFPTGVTAICALVGGKPEGIIASSFTSVSLDPPYVSVCIAHTSKTWQRLRGATRLGVSVLGAAHRDTCRVLASGSEGRFDAVEWEAPDDEDAFIRASCAWMDCRMVREVEVGDHDFIVLEVGAVLDFPDTAPLIFHGSTFREIAV